MLLSGTFTHPDYRNRGIGRRLSMASDHSLAELGYRRHVSLIRVNNAASLRMSFRKGTRPVLYISSSGFLFYRRYHVSKELPRKVAALLASTTSPDGDPGRTGAP